MMRDIVAEVIERDCEPCGEVACSINGENMRCDMPAGHKGGHSITLPIGLNRPSVRETERDPFWHGWAYGVCFGLLAGFGLAMALL